MRNKYKKIFQTNPKLLEQMLKDRQSGMRYYSLANKYNCDRSSIMWQCQKYNIQPNRLIKIKRKEIKKVISEFKKVRFKEKNYRDYLQEAIAREPYYRNFKIIKNAFV